MYSVISMCLFYLMYLLTEKQITSLDPRDLYYSEVSIHLVYECVAVLTTAGNSTLLTRVFTTD